MSYMSAMYKNMLESLFEDLKVTNFIYIDCSTDVHSGYYCNDIYVEDYPSDASIDETRLNKQLDVLRGTIKNIFNNINNDYARISGEHRASSYPVERIIEMIRDRIYESKDIDDIEEDLKDQIEQLCVLNFMLEDYTRD